MTTIPTDLSALSVLAIGAHPDDIEILCGGTMARYAEAGATVTFAIATNGEVGGGDPDRAAIASRRFTEAKASTSRLGAELIWMGFPDEMLFNDRPTREAFIDAYRLSRADVVFVHSTDDYHPDHRVAGQVALDSRIPSAVPHVRTRYPALERIPHLFVMDTLGGIAFEPEFLIDISAQQPVKEELLRLHASQVDWMRHAYGDDYIADARRQAEVRAAGTDWAYVEGFRSVPTYPVTGGPELLPGPWLRQG
ncbi:PIG-L deacetylase family protein [Microbacterium oxydans]|uniref:PIG-L deacetylase family protein n=1 Tax=Microbacterium oxydans TaxID=82380 RepID=UPI000CB59F58|nr:PIG-L deacetylase family protein [Microbacterium oxydans]MCZ4302485.1 PIG-L family deacetylase [Microbacterium oxydans]PKQ36593.1 MAG: PIG-L family deacetylase [Actinobacteria bacterium HGW-Actinobacteria-11]